MNNDIKAALITTAVFLLSALLLYVGYRIVPFGNIKALVQLRMLSDALTVVNLAIIAFLVYSYSKSYIHLKSRFTLGLLLFLASMLFFVMSSSHTLLQALGFFSQDAGTSSAVELDDLVPLFFSTVSLAILAFLNSQ